VLLEPDRLFFGQPFAHPIGGYERERLLDDVTLSSVLG
jgi:hypothetical protein